MKKGDKVTSSYIAGVFTINSLDENKGFALLKQRGCKTLVKVPIKTLCKV